MKQNDYLKQLRSKDNKALVKMLKEQYDKLYDLRFSDKFRNLKDISQIKKTKKNIAKIYTILNENIDKE